MIRAILSDLESKLKSKIDPNHSMLTWIARHAAFLLTRFRIGDDGKSAYQRAVGREWRRPNGGVWRADLVQTRGCRGQEEKLTFGATSGHGTLCGNSEQEC